MKLELQPFDCSFDSIPIYLNQEFKLTASKTLKGDNKKFGSNLTTISLQSVNEQGEVEEIFIFHINVGDYIDMIAGDGVLTMPVTLKSQPPYEDRELTSA